jgi:RHS repeat-associated protein
LHIGGQVCANCGWQWYQFNLTNLGALAGRAIQAGDTLRWVQWSNGGSKGGLIIAYTDGTDSCCSSAPAINDQNGEAIARGNLSTNQWEYRIASLSPVAGKIISQVRLYADGQTAPGQWDIYYQDLVYTAADGTIIPLFSQNATVPSVSGFGSTGMTATSATIQDCGLPACTPAPVDSTTYFHADQIGSARLLSAGRGYPVWQGTFTPFGQEVSPQLTTNHYKFNGKERGEATEGGLDYFGARYYSSVIGRWMTPDWSDEPSPIPYAKLTNPQSLNLYSYVTDDPVSHTDMNGHFQTAAASGVCRNDNGDVCKHQEIIDRDNNKRTVTILVKTQVTSYTKDWKGTNLTVVTLTATVATYSTDGLNSGKYLGGIEVTKTDTYYSDVHNIDGSLQKMSDGASPVTRPINEQEAFKAVGRPGFEDITRPTMFERFSRETSADMQAHPLKYGGYALTAAALPIGAVSATAGIITSIIGLGAAVADDSKSPNK